MPALLVKLIPNNGGDVIEAQLIVNDTDTPTQVQERYDALDAQLFRNRNVGDYTVDRSAVDAFIGYVKHMYN